jgi:single-strand DNA-binding protein
MATLNKVFLIGNLTRDPELRYIPGGTAVTTFGLAVSRNYKTQTGESREEVCFVRVVVWGKQAEACSQYLNKGRPVFIEGRLQYRSWEDQNGNKRNTLEVKADRVQFLSRIQREGELKETQEIENQQAIDDNQEVNSQDEEVPF